MALASVVGFMSASGDLVKVTQLSEHSVFPTSESKAAIELLDVFHEFRHMKGATGKCLEKRDKFLNCLNSFKKICKSPDKSEEIKRISSTVKRHLERFEPVVQKSLLIEMRVFCRKYNYYDGFEPAGTSRRSKVPRLV